MALLPVSDARNTVRRPFVTTPFANGKLKTPKKTSNGKYMNGAHDSELDYIRDIF